MYANANRKHGVYDLFLHSHSTKKNLSLHLEIFTFGLNNFFFNSHTFQFGC